MMTKRRRTRGIVATAAAATMAISGGATYALIQRRAGSTTSVDLTIQERWSILQRAVALRQQEQNIDWDGLRRQQEEQENEQQQRRLQSSGVPIPVYDYNRGNCPNEGSLGVPCSPPDLSLQCNKNRGKFSRCLVACEPSYCCIHDTPESTNAFAPSCQNDENCAQYAPCYLAWWKLQDMVGPATEFQLEQADDFFDVDILQDVITDPLFFEQLLFHHFQDINPILELLGNADSLQDVFAMPEVWDANSGISGKAPPGTR